MTSPARKSGSAELLCRLRRRPLRHKQLLVSSFFWATISSTDVSCAVSDNNMTDIEKDAAVSHKSSLADPAQYTLRTRTWRRHVTPFEQIYGQSYAGAGTADAPFIVEWLKDDAENPQMHSMAFKWVLVLVVSIATLVVALASSAYSGAVRSVGRDFGVGQEVQVLGVSLFVLGFAIGCVVR